MHPYRQTTIDRALASNTIITSDHVVKSNTLRAVAFDYVQTYQGHNTFVQSVALQLADRGSLSIAQLCGALNVMVTEYRIAQVGKNAQPPFNREQMAQARATEQIAIDNKKPMFTVPNVPMVKPFKLATAELSKGSKISGGSGDPRQLTKRQLQAQQRKAARWAKAQAEIDELFPE